MAEMDKVLAQMKSDAEMVMKERVQEIAKQTIPVTSV
jgi:hypothetical protein